MARSGVIYGPTGSRKTTAVKHFAHYIAEKTGKATLLLSADGGGWAPCDPEIEVGMILPYRCESSALPLPILRRISQGMWPKDSRETSPEKINLVPIDWNQVGGIAVEGWTSIGAMVMRYLPDKNVNVGGEDRSKLGTFSLPIHVNGQVVTERFSSSTRGDFGFVQAFLYGFTMNMNSLPCDYVLYTALESKTEDDDRTTIFGPSLPGKKATAACPSWIGDCIHAQDYTVERAIKVANPQKPNEQMDATVLDTAVRYHFLRHPDPATGITFPAKPRVTPERITELLKRFPGGFFEPTPEHGFDLYLKTVDELAAGQADALRGWREKMDQKLGRGGASAQTAATTTAK